MSTGTETTQDTPAKQEFIPAEVYEEDNAEISTYENIEVNDWDQTMSDLASQEAKTLRVPRNTQVSRKAVVNAFINAFELIGGVPRLALWAHSNPSDFYKLYARLLPSQASSALGESNEITIRHILPRTGLDV